MAFESAASESNIRPHIAVDPTRFSPTDEVVMSRLVVGMPGGQPLADFLIGFANAVVDILSFSEYY